MNEAQYFEPTWTSAPGATLSDLMTRKGIDRVTLAELAGERLELIDELLAGRRKLTRSLANVVSEVLGGTEEFWLRRERQYREDVTRQRLMVLGDSAEWLSEMPVPDLIRNGWLTSSPSATRLDDLLEFFGVPSLDEWRSRYAGLASAVSFRTSPIFSSHLGSTLTWLRIGELSAAGQRTGPLDRDRLREVLPAMRALSRIKSPEIFLPILRGLCNEAGVSLVVAEAPKGCRASGATWLTPSGAAICLLSHRYKTDDQFWFTFFHEMGHLCLHADRTIFLEDGEEIAGDEENEANQFSADVLIPEPARSELRKLAKTHKDVIRFAMGVGVSAGIVVGQMQHMRLIPPSWLNGTKRSLVWGSASEANE